MIRNQSNELTVRPKRSSSTIMVLVVLGLLLIAVVAYFSYFEGFKKGYKDFEGDKVLLQQLSKSVNESKEELSTNQQDLVFAQRQHQIQEEAYKQLSKAYANSEEKNSVLRSHISEVYALHTMPGVEAGEFHTCPGPIMAAVDTFHLDIEWG